MISMHKLIYTQIRNTHFLHSNIHTHTYTCVCTESKLIILQTRYELIFNRFIFKPKQQNNLKLS